MPLYLVRWPNLSASLVTASSEGELLEILDQVDNPEGCTWSVYDGPLFIDFSLPARFRIERDDKEAPLRPDQVVLEDVRDLYDHFLDVSVADGDQGTDMVLAVIKGAFPALDRLLTIKGLEPEEAKLRQAVQEELGMLVADSWRRAGLAKKDDKVSQLARMMDMPVELVKRLQSLARKRGKQDGGEPEEEGDDG